MKRSLAQQISIGLGVTLFLLVANMLMSYRNILKLIDNEQQVSHTHQVLTKLEAVLSTLRDSETGQRGYLITGEVRYLEPYQKAIAQIDAEVKKLQQLTADHPRQQQRLDTLKKAIASKLTELQQTIQLRQAQGFEAAQQVVLTNQGKQIMDGIRQQLADMEQAENQLLQQQAKESRDSA